MLFKKKNRAGEGRYVLRVCLIEKVIVEQRLESIGELAKEQYGERAL